MSGCTYIDGKNHVSVQSKYGEVYLNENGSIAKKNAQTIVVLAAPLFKSECRGIQTNHSLLPLGLFGSNSFWIELQAANYPQLYVDYHEVWSIGKPIFNHGTLIFWYHLFGEVNSLTCMKENPTLHVSHIGGMP